MTENRRKGILLLVVTSVLWSTSGVLIKGITWDGFTVAGLRSLIAAMTMVWFVGKLDFRITFSRAGAVIAYACTVTCIGLANKYTTAANAVLLQFTSPIYTALLGWLLLKEKITKYNVISIVMILAGLSVFFSGGLSTGHLVGDLLALFAGVAFGSVCVFLRLEKDSNPVQCTFFGNILSFLVCLPFMGAIHFTAVNTVSILLLGVFQLGLSYVLFTRAIKNVTALQANIIPVIEPLLNPVWVMLVQKEFLAMTTVIGGVIVIAGISGRELWLLVRKMLHPDDAKASISE